MKNVYFFIGLVCIVGLSVLFSSGAFTAAEVAAKSETAAEQPHRGGILTISEFPATEAIGFPPKSRGGARAMRQGAPAIETLLRLDKRGKPIPWLATGFKEDAAAKTITLTLRRNVKFHDGTDFNAEAVKWNLDQCIVAKTAGAEKFKSIDVVDNYTVRINLTEWDSTLTPNLAAQMPGQIISPTAYKKNGEEWSANNPVGTGPFQIVKWRKDVDLTYKRFDGYWQKGKPYLDGLKFVYVIDPVSRVLSFKAGEADILLQIDPKDVADLEKGGYVVKANQVGSGAFGLIFDSADPKSPFADVRVRRAAQYAVDTQTICKKVFQGFFDPTNQLVPKDNWAYNAGIAGYPYNPKKARQLLAEAGYPGGFKTKMLVQAGDLGDSMELYVAVQGYLEDVGINAEIEVMQAARRDQIMYEGHSWEGMVKSTVSSNPDLVAHQVRMFGGIGRAFVSMATPEDYLKAMDNAVAARDFNGKQKWAKELQKLVIDKYCLRLVIASFKQIDVSRKSVHNHGFCATPTAANWSPEEAWVEGK